MGFRLTKTGGWLPSGPEDRTLTAPSTPSLAPYVSTAAPLTVTTGNALRVADAYACVRVIADSISSLPLHVFRKTAEGRVPAGDGSRAARLLDSPSPGSTGVDLISQILVHLNVHGDAFVGKYRNADGEIAQLGLLPPDSVQVELRGQRIVYTLDTAQGRTEHGPGNILHIKGMSLDGLRGLSPVTQCRVALGLSTALQEFARQYFENGSRPSGVLTVQGANPETVNGISARWADRHGGVAQMHKVAVMSGDVTFTPIAFSADDNQFLQQRELSAREVARVFRVPAWAIDAPTGDSLTYSNVLEQSRALVTHSLRPWIVRIERALSGDSDLCPGSTYAQFDLDGLLRADADVRSQIYARALDPQLGWMRRDEVRALEDLEPEPEPVAPVPAATPASPPAVEEEPDV